MSAFQNYRQSLRGGLATTQHAPVARRCNRRGLAKPGHRGNIQGDGWRLRRSGHANFPCHGEYYPAFPLIRFAMLSTFSRLGEGFYRYALCKKLGCSAQLSQSAKSDFYTQQTPPWHADAIGAGWRSQTKGESRKRTEESLLSSGRFRLSPATGAGRQCRLPVLSA